MPDPATVSGTSGFATTMLSSFSGQGSGFMWAITAALALGIAVTVDRIWRYARWRVNGPAILAKIDSGDLDGAAQLAGDTPPGRILRAGAAQTDPESAWDAMGAESALVESDVRGRLPYLSMVSNVATMFGLLGTVYGLIIAFSALSDTSSAERATRLSVGIATAMATTAWGLIVAIPALAIYTALDAHAGRVLALCEAVAARVAVRKRG